MRKIYLVTLSPNTHRTSEENLGIEYLKSSLVNGGYEVEIIDAWLNEIPVKDVYEKLASDKDNILFVGISSYMSNTAPSVELTKMLKNLDSNIKIVSGGFGPTFYPMEYLLSGSDFAIRGEGEEAILELANYLNYGGNIGNIKNIGYYKNGEVILNAMRCLNNDLDSLPFPARDNLDVVMSKKSTINMVTARGCSGNCEFCSVISFFRLSDGRIWRTRSIPNIVSEIEELYKKGVTFIKMVDDSFVDGIRDEEWCQEFADEINRRDIHVHLRGQIRADKVTDGILENLKRAGFFSFACGIENGSPTALARMNKAATIDDNKRALELFKKYNYLVQMGFILFDKETTFKELEENYAFMKEYEFAVTKGIFSEMFSAEGTKLNTRLRQEHALEESDFISNNNKYRIESEVVADIYQALKRWHKSHAPIYDMTIDPLTAPKAISWEAMQEYYEYVLALKRMDLEIFRELLERMKSDPYYPVMDYVAESIIKSSDEYKEISENVQRLNRKNKLNYNAQINPFI